MISWKFSYIFSPLCERYMCSSCLNWLMGNPQKSINSFEREKLQSSRLYDKINSFYLYMCILSLFIFFRKICQILRNLFTCHLNNFCVFSNFCIYILIMLFFLFQQSQFSRGDNYWIKQQWRNSGANESWNLQFFQPFP